MLANRRVRLHRRAERRRFPDVEKTPGVQAAIALGGGTLIGCEDGWHAFPRYFAVSWRCRALTGRPPFLKTAHSDVTAGAQRSAEGQESHGRDRIPDHLVEHESGPAQCRPQEDLDQDMRGHVGDGRSARPRVPHSG